MVGREHARRLWDMARGGQGAGARPDRRHAHARHLPPRRRPCLLDRRPRCAQAHAYAEKLRRDYGYDQLEPLDRDGIRALIGSTAYQGRRDRPGRGPCPPAELRARAGAGGRRRPGARSHEGSRGAPASTTARRPVVRTDAGPGDVRPRDPCRQRLSRRAGAARSRRGSCRSTTSSSRPNRWATARASVLSEPVAVADTQVRRELLAAVAKTTGCCSAAAKATATAFPTSSGPSRKPMLEIYPQLADVRIDYAWGGTLAITMNRMPCFTAVAAERPVGLGLFRARRGAGDAGGQADGRGGGGPGRAVRPDGEPAAAALSRRRRPALAAAGAGDDLVLDARPAGRSDAADPRVRADASAKFDRCHQLVTRQIARLPYSFPKEQFQERRKDMAADGQTLPPMSMTPNRSPKPRGPRSTAC